MSHRSTSGKFGDILNFADRIASGKEATPEVYGGFVAHGYQCRVIQGPFSINGYIGVPSWHPAYGEHYDDLNKFIGVHGGLTYAGVNLYGQEESGLWWFGFDTFHHDSGDWSVEDVAIETRKLAGQFATKYGALIGGKR